MQPDLSIPTSLGGWVPSAAAYLLPLLPFLVRLLVVALPNRKRMREELSPAAKARDAHRTIILALAGFSFTGLLGLVALDAQITSMRFQLAIYFLLVSFLSYLFALNLQGYKAFRWEDQVGDAAMEAASLGLLAAVVSIILHSGASSAFKALVTILSAGVWILDFSVRVSLQTTYLKKRTITASPDHEPNGRNDERERAREVVAGGGMGGRSS